MTTPAPSPAPDNAGPKPDDIVIKGRIGTDPEELARWARHVVDEGKPIEDMEIADLRLLIEAVQNHPHAKTATGYSRWEPEPPLHIPPHFTCLTLVRGRIIAATLGPESLHFDLSSFDGSKQLSRESTIQSNTFSITISLHIHETTIQGPAWFVGCDFCANAVFKRVRFSNSAQFFSAFFALEADFSESRFDQHAIFRQARFRTTACFESAFIANKLDLCDVRFDNGAWFVNATFERFLNSETSLKGWHLEGVKKLRLNGQDLKDVRFPPNTQEAWHVLRRNYTGTAFFFHFILLIAFLGGYAAKVLFWTGVNRAQVAITDTAARLEQAAASAATAHPESAAVISSAAGELANVKQSLTQQTQEYPVWQVLLGLDRGWGPFALAITLIVYNVFRAWLTKNIGAMRDESDRSGFAPYWKDYKLAWYIHHYFMRWVLWIAVISFIYHAWHWLKSPVWLPA